MSGDILYLFIYLFIYIFIYLFILYLFFKNKILKFDPLEAQFKTFKGMLYGPYCAMSGTEHSSVTLYKPTTIAR